MSERKTKGQWCHSGAWVTLMLLGLSICLGSQREAAAAENDAASPRSPYLHPLVAGTASAPSFQDGKFSVDRHQTVVFLGGTNAVELQRYDYVETLLTIAFAEHRLQFRNLGWQADTVFRQQRPRHFYHPPPKSYGGETDRRDPIPADTIFFWMGQSESLEGPERLDAFVESYEGMLDQLATVTPRIVLVTPVPFEQHDELLLDVAKRNDSLRQYVEAIRQIAAKRNLPVVDLFKGIGEDAAASSGRLTRNTMHLTAAGHWKVAQVFAQQLGLKNNAIKSEWNAATATLKPTELEKLRQEIQEKNRLWFTFWRPTNWAFLYGNRQEQPSSRDHRDRRKRWFPDEVVSVQKGIAEAEQTIHTQATKLAATKNN